MNMQSATPLSLPDKTTEICNPCSTVSGVSSDLTKADELLDPTVQSPEMRESQTLSMHDVQINDNVNLLENGKNVLCDEENEILKSVPYIHVTVTSPQKIGDGMSSYIAYNVKTVTNLQIYKKSMFSVNRRFSDFLGLHEKLMDKFLRHGRIIPPAPEKNVIGTTRVKMSGEKCQTQNTTSLDFIEKRRASLERFLNRIASHPVLSLDPDFREFLESDIELPKAINTSALSSARVMRLFSKVGETVNKITYKMEENDMWFEETANRVELFDAQFRSLQCAVDALTNQRKELSNCTEGAAKYIAIIGRNEPSPSLSRTLVELAAALEKVETIRMAQTNVDLYNFGETIKDYVALFGSIKNVLNERVKIFQNWKNAQYMLNKKRDQKIRLEQVGRSDKLNAATTEVIEWESKVDSGQEEFNNISKTIKTEFKRCETVRVIDMRKKYVTYLENMIEYQSNLCKNWESFLHNARSIL